MPRKNVLLKFQPLTNGSMTGDLTSMPTSIQYMDNAAYQVNWSGTPVGTFNVQVSIDYAQDDLGNILNTGNWNNLILNPQPAASGSAGSYYIELNQVSAPWVRLTYTHTSSTGTLNVFICGKEI